MTRQNFRRFALRTPKSLVISLDVLLNAGGQALPDLQTKLALLNTCQFIAKSLFAGIK